MPHQQRIGAGTPCMLSSRWPPDRCSAGTRSRPTWHPGAVVLACQGTKGSACWDVVLATLFGADKVVCSSRSVTNRRSVTGERNSLRGMLGRENFGIKVAAISPRPTADIGGAARCRRRPRAEPSAASARVGSRGASHGRATIGTAASHSPSFPTACVAGRDGDRGEGALCAGADPDCGVHRGPAHVHEQGGHGGGGHREAAAHVQRAQVHRAEARAKKGQAQVEDPRDRGDLRRAEADALAGGAGRAARRALRAGAERLRQGQDQRARGGQG
eukprot:scaffold66831_cov69-Phaeocystis_antarctica.AAC.5